MTDEELGSLGSRRDFFKKMLALGFAVPVISSFALEGVASAKPTTLTSHIAGDQQTLGNGGLCVTDPFGDPPFELCANQSFANQFDRPDRDEDDEPGGRGEGEEDGGSGGETGTLRGGRKLLW